MKIRGHAIIRNPDGKGVARITISTRAKTKKLAKSALAKLANTHLRNIAAGFYDEDGQFHPIRASHDYSKIKAGEAKAHAKSTRKKGQAIS